MFQMAKHEIGISMKVSCIKLITNPTSVTTGRRVLFYSASGCVSVCGSVVKFIL